MNIHLKLYDYDERVVYDDVLDKNVSIAETLPQILNRSVLYRDSANLFNFSLGSICSSLEEIIEEGGLGSSFDLRNKDKITVCEFELVGEYVNYQDLNWEASTHEFDKMRLSDLSDSFDDMEEDDILVMEELDENGCDDRVTVQTSNDVEKYLASAYDTLVQSSKQATDAKKKSKAKGLFSEDEVAIKGIKPFTYHVGDYSYECSIVSIEVDGKVYELIVGVVDEEIRKDFDKLRLKRSSYYTLPEPGEVPVPKELQKVILKYHDTLSKEIRNKILELYNRLFCKNCIFFTVSKDDFYAIIEAQRLYFEDVDKRNNTLELLRQGAEFEREEDLDNAISAYRQCIVINHECSIDAYTKLVNIYKKRKDFLNERDILQQLIKRFGGNKKGNFGNRLIALEKILSGSSLKNTSVIEREVFRFEHPAADEMERIIKTYFREFNFEPLPDYMYERICYTVECEKYGEYARTIRLLMKQAVAYEEQGDLVNAARFYEQVIAHHTMTATPYERLIVIYSKTKSNAALKSVLEYSITFFNQRKEAMLKYLFELAEKYNKVDYVESIIKNNETLNYSYPAYTLYAPFSFVEKWEKRLERISQVKQSQEKVGPILSEEKKEIDKQFTTISYNGNNLLVQKSSLLIKANDLALLLGYKDPKVIISSHFKNAEMIRYPRHLPSGNISIQTAKFVTEKDAMKLIGIKKRTTKDISIEHISEIETWLVDSLLRIRKL